MAIRRLGFPQSDAERLPAPASVATAGSRPRSALVGSKVTIPRVAAGYRRAMIPCTSAVSCDMLTWYRFVAT